jgi:valyl-tRNA synthetase
MADDQRIQACRDSLLRVQEKLRRVQTDYKTVAQERIALQRNMARINQTVQKQSNDVELVEDIIVISLQSEETARQCVCQMKDPSRNRPAPSAEATLGRTRTSSLEEAMAHYQKQIETVEEDLEYREALHRAESDMVAAYKEGLNAMAEVVAKYCQEDQVKQHVEGLTGVKVTVEN